MQNHEADIVNTNKGTKGTNETYDKNQGNRGKQMNPMGKDVFKDDRDGKVYNTITLDDMVIMAEDLKYESPGSIEGKYGRYYDWDSAQESCPTGWHLPTEREWSILADYAQSCRKLKSKTDWPSCNGTDDLGFSAYPNGYVINFKEYNCKIIQGVGTPCKENSDCMVHQIGECAGWWGGEMTASGPRCRSIWDDVGDRPFIGGTMMFQGVLKSIRCVKDYQETAPV